MPAAQSRAAALVLQAIEARVLALADGDPTGAILDDLGALVRQPGFRAARESPRVLHGVSAAELKDWWQRGGGAWLRLQTEDCEPDKVWLPPDLRPAVANVLACRSQDGGCGETEGWRLRLQDWLDEVNEPPILAWQDCTLATHRLPTARRYPVWRQCLERNRPRDRVLPLGRTRAPASGWFLLRGSRGWCDEIRLFDLETGGAFLVSECFDPRTGRSPPTSTRGRVPIDNLREAAWATIMQTMIRRFQIAPHDYELPYRMITPATDVTNLRPETDEPEDVYICMQPTLLWAWLADGAPLVETTVKANCDAACILWRIAEAALTPHCPRRPPEWAMPRGIAGEGPREARLVRALQDLVAAPCTEAFVPR
jgi:hypothetical protein